MAAGEPQQLEVLNSFKKKPLVCHGGYLYQFHCINADNTCKFWRCEKREECNGRIWTDLNNRFLRQAREHTHGPSAARVAVKKMKGEMKERAAEVGLTTQEIVVGERELLPEAAGGDPSMPKLPSLKRAIQREREQVHMEPVLPRNLEELQIPEQYRFITKGKSMF